MAEDETDDYGRRQRRKKAGGQGCVITLIAMATAVAGFVEGFRWLV